MNKQLIGISKLFSSLLLLAIILAPVLSGCSKESNDREKVIASVNKEQISLKEFQREIALRSKQNPHYKVTPQTVKEQLDTVIDRKIMIQEAMKNGLANNEDFVRTIQTFWEQTLIRELIAAKNHEWEDRLFVTEQEIQDFYSRMNKEDASMPPLESISDQIKRALLEQKKTAALEEWLTDVRAKASIDINTELINEFGKVEEQTVKGGTEDVR